MIEYVSQEAFDAICKAMDERQKAVQKAKEQLANARTLAEKIEAKRALKAAQQMEVD